MGKTFILTAIVALVAAWPAPALDIYVAPGGDDLNTGTAEEPYGSLWRAQDAVRVLIATGLTEDVTVHLKGGLYPMPAPFALGPQDSGTAEHTVTYTAEEGETPVLSGGHIVRGWQSAGGGKWTVMLPETQGGQWSFRELYADGNRLRRGRYPNGGALLRVAAVTEDVTGITLNEAPPVESLTGKGAELVMYQNWSISRVPIAKSEGALLTTTVPVGWIGHGSATTASPDKPCYIENVLEFVDEPGEWYLDNISGVLTYQAAPDEDPNERTFVAPRAQQLLTLRGTADAPIQNLHFKGIAFEYTAWLLPEFGYLGIQAGHHGTHMQGPIYVLPLAIEAIETENCSFEACTIAHTGASAIGFGKGCRNNRVAGCTIEDIGGNGVMVGWRGTGEGDNLVGDASLSADWKDPVDVPTGNEVSNNTVRRCGAACHGAVGIYDGFCAETKIAHNLVEDLPYTGISVGFRWDESETSQRGTIVEYNHVRDCMKMLADGGCIYTLGSQPGTVLRGNLLHDVHRSEFAHGGAPNNGIFFDQGSKGYLVEGNIIYNTSGDPLRFNQTSKENMTWKDNSLGVAPDDPAFPVEAAKMAGPETVAAEPEAAPVEKTEPETAATEQAQPEAEEGK